MEHLEIIMSLLHLKKEHVATRACSFVDPHTNVLGLLAVKNVTKINPAKAEVIPRWPKPLRFLS